MTDEEKKFKSSHFENIDELIKTCKIWIKDDDWDAYCRFFDMGAMEELINLIEKQQKEIEHQKEKRENQKKELAILNAKQIEFNKLVNTVNSYKGQFKKQQEQIEELKEKNKELIEGQTDTLEKILAPELLKKYVSKDKIKAKIEEYKKQIQKLESKKLWEEPVDTIKYNRYVCYINAFLSLLEKE